MPTQYRSWFWSKTEATLKQHWSNTEATLKQQRWARCTAASEAGNHYFCNGFEQRMFVAIWETSRQCSRNTEKRRAGARGDTVNVSTELAGHRETSIQVCAIHCNTQVGIISGKRRTQGEPGGSWPAAGAHSEKVITKRNETQRFQTWAKWGWARGRARLL